MTHGKNELIGIGLVAITNIAPNTELFCSYGDDENSLIFESILAHEGAVEINPPN